MERGFLQRARKLREIAKLVDLEEVRKELLKLADEYEGMALNRAEGKSRPC